MTAADNPKQAQIDEAAASKALSEAKTAAENARKAQYEAEAAALKAKFGDIPSSGYTGTASAATGAGGTEGMLLGAKALNVIAKRFADKIEIALSPSSAPTDTKKAVTILLFGSASFPDFQALTVQETQYLSLQQAIEHARSIDKLKAYPVVKPLSAAGIGLGLDALNKLLAYAKTDYSFAHIDITTTDSMLIAALAGMLSAQNINVELPYTYLANTVAAENPAYQRTNEIYKWGVEAKKTIKEFQLKQVLIEKRLDDNRNDATLIKDLQTAKDGVATWSAVGDAIDAWSKTATTADDKGNVPLASVLRQAAIKQKLDNGAAFLVVQVHKAAGTTYTKKNILSSFGGNPFFIMGGAVASYSLFDGKTGYVISSSLAPFHSGYLSVDDMEGAVNDHVK